METYWSQIRLVEQRFKHAVDNPYNVLRLSLYAGENNWGLTQSDFKNIFDNFVFDTRLRVCGA